jgi:hypothetical protein
MNFFEPSATHATGMRGAMDKALWASARDMLAEAGCAPVAEPSGPSGSDPTSFLDFAAYFELDACLRESELASGERKDAAIAHLRARLAAGVPLEPVAAPPRLSNFTNDWYTAEQLDQMSRWWDAEPANRMALTAASGSEFDRTGQAIDIAMSYLAKAAPEILGELQIVIRDIVLAKPDGSNLMNYSGATSFGLWGAITVNAETQREWIQLYRQLVHELGHNLLFAIARDEPLVKADPSVRRPSPIRADPRPLDGIFHAAFVSAREALALEALLAWHERGGNLPGDDAEIVADTLELSVLAFWQCLDTLRAEKELGPTEFGEAILADCESFMTANFSLEPV